MRCGCRTIEVASKGERDADHDWCVTLFAIDRCEQMFDIIIDFPESMNGLRDMAVSSVYIPLLDHSD